MDPDVSAVSEGVVSLSLCKKNHKKFANLLSFCMNLFICLYMNLKNGGPTPPRESVRYVWIHRGGDKMLKCKPLTKFQCECA